MDQRLQILLDNKKFPFLKKYLKNLYDYLEERYFSKEAFKEVSELLDIEESRIKKQLSIYNSDYLKSTDVELKFRISDYRKREPINLGFENPILKPIGLTTNYLWNNKIEEEFVLKYMYDRCLKGNFSAKSYENIANELKISVSKIKEFVKIYALTFLDMDKDKFFSFVASSQAKSKRDDRKINSKLFKVYENILKISKPLEIKEYMINSEYEPMYIKRTFSSYSHLFAPADREKISKRIDSGYKLILDDKKRESVLKKEERLKNLEEEKNKIFKNKVKVVIEGFIKSDKPLLDYCISNKISLDDFKSYYDYIKENDKDLFDELINVKGDIPDLDSNYMNAVIDKISCMIENKVEDNNKLREMDILDIFSLTRKRTDYLLNIGISRIKNKQVLYKFRGIMAKIKKYKAYDTDLVDIKAIREETTIVDVEFDKKGRIIEGSGRVISLEEKNNIINYLKENNYPLNKTTYRAAFLRYRNGFITFDKKEVKKKELEVNA